MKNLIALGAVALALGCSSSPSVTDAGAVDIGADLATTDVPAADTPVTDVPSSDVPAADVPVTDVPAADVPVTDVPASDVPRDVVASDACMPITDDTRGQGVSCRDGVACPAGYTCQAFSGIVLDHRCQILCRETCECPTGQECLEVRDKAGSWFQCGR